jgi:hypothetical protein
MIGAGSIGFDSWFSFEGRFDDEVNRKAWDIPGKWAYFKRKVRSKAKASA